MCLSCNLEHHNFFSWGYHITKTKLVLLCEIFYKDMLNMNRQLHHKVNPRSSLVMISCNLSNQKQESYHCKKMYGFKEAEGILSYS